MFDTLSNNYFQLRPGRKSLHTLSVNSCGSAVPFHLLPCRLKRLGSVHFVDQAEPFPSFDAVFQRRQHALIPHRSFHPPPISAVGLCALCSPYGHCRRLAFALLRCETHASTFLPPVPRRSFALCASRRFRRFGTMKALTPAPLTTHSAGLPAYLTTPSCRSVSNHVGLPDHRLPPRQRDQRVSDFALSEQARRSTPAESSSFSYRPTIRLQLLPTPLRADAVTFSYGAVAYSGTDFHRADVAPSRAHSPPNVLIGGPVSESAWIPA
jgi:hypothetical protein